MMNNYFLSKTSEPAVKQTLTVKNALPSTQVRKTKERSGRERSNLRKRSYESYREI